MKAIYKFFIRAIVALGMLYWFVFEFKNISKAFTYTKAWLIDNICITAQIQIVRIIAAISLAWIAQFFVFLFLFNKIKTLPEYDRVDIIRLFRSIRSFVRSAILTGSIFLILQSFIPQLSLLSIFSTYKITKVFTITLIVYVFWTLWVLNRYICNLYIGLSTSQNKLEKDKIKVTYEIIKNVVYIGLSFLLIIALWTIIFGNESTAVLQMIAFISAGLSIAAQKTIMDLINGMLIRWENSIRTDDWLEFDGRTAVVEEIALRYMRIRYDCGMLVTIPFHEISIIRNKTRQYSYVVYDMSFDIAVPVETAHKVVLEAFANIMNSENKCRMYKDNIEIRGIADLTGFSYVMQYRLCVQPKWQYKIQLAFNNELKGLFEKYNINIAKPMVANVKSVPSLSTGKEYPDQP